MFKDQILNDFLVELGINVECYNHPPAPTIEIAKTYWKEFDATHCKNIFLRNHKGNQHFLVLLPCDFNVNIRHLELKLKQGKLSFASPERLYKYLKLLPGSVSPYGLIYDTEKHVIVYMDKSLKSAEKLSFHPNENTASIVTSNEDFMKYIHACQNQFEFVDLATDSE